VEARGKESEFVALSLYVRGISVARVDANVVWQYKNFFCYGFDYLFEISWRPCLSRPATENSVSRYQVMANLKA